MTQNTTHNVQIQIFERACGYSALLPFSVIFFFFFGFEFLFPPYLHGARIINKPYTQPVISIVFENRFGGRIIFIKRDGSTETIAQVLKPVAALGEFNDELTSDDTMLVIPVEIDERGNPSLVEPSASRRGFRTVSLARASLPDVDDPVRHRYHMVIGPRKAGEYRDEGLKRLFELIADLKRDCIPVSISFSRLSRPVSLPGFKNEVRIDFDQMRIDVRR